MMNILEKVRAEVERLKQKALQSAVVEKEEKRPAWQRQVNYYEGKVAAYRSILDFLDILFQETLDGDLDDVADLLTISLEEEIGTSPHSRETIKNHLLKIANWQKSRACENK